MALTADVAKVRGIFTKGLRAVRARRVVRAELAQRPPMPDGTVEIAVYFTDGAENLYQIDQWYEPLRRLHERHHVTVLSRNWEATRELLRSAPVPVHPAPNIDEVEAVFGRQRIRAMLYDASTTGASTSPSVLNFQRRLPSRSTEYPQSSSAPKYRFPWASSTGPP